MEERCIGKFDLIGGNGSDKQKLRNLSESVTASAGKSPEEVVLKATGRGIEKVLSLAIHFQGQDDCTVRLRTSSVGVIDDIVQSTDTMSESGNGIVQEDEDHFQGEELPESRIRKLSVVEVAVTLK